jgi:hypothetical protein
VIISDVTYMLVLGFGVYVIFSLFYERAIRPMLCDRTRFKLFALRDTLRRLAIDGQIEATSNQYQYLEQLLCKLINKCAWFAWTSFFEFVWRHGDAELSPEAVDFDRSADPQLKKIYTEAVDEMTHLLLTNSPMWTFVLGISVAIGLLFGHAWKQWLEIKTKIFLEEPLVVDPGFSPA